MPNTRYLQCNIPNGETIAYREHGSGTDHLILVHGNVSTSLYWDHFMQGLPDAWHVLAVDLRGAGNSSYLRPVEYIRQFSEDIAMLAHELGIAEFNLAGLSMGGLVCQQLTADHPDLIRRLILVSSPGCQGFPMLAKDSEGHFIPGRYWSHREELMNDPVQVMPFLQNIRDRDLEQIKAHYSATVFNFQPPPEKLYTRLMNEVLSCRNYPDCLWPMHIFNISPDFNGLRPGTGECARITMPVLILYGNRDILVPADHAQELASAIGENARVQAVTDAGHIPFIDQEEAVRQIFETFLTDNNG